MSEGEREKARKSMNKLKTCPFRRSIRFQDSLMFFQSSLSGLIDDLHVSSKKENLPLKTTFATSKAYCDSLGFSQTQFEKFISVKMPMPYEFLTDYQTMVNTTSPPPPSAFKSTLRGVDEITTAEHEIFVSMWNTLGCQNLLDILHLYSVADVTMYCDAVVFLMEKLFNLTHLYPSHYLTLASLAVASLLYNGKCPSGRQQRLNFPFLDEQTYNIISQNCLTGGYAVNSCQYSKFTFGYCPETDVAEEEDEETMSSSFFLDYNRYTK